MIGKILEYMRKKNNFSQEDIAKIINVKQNTLSRYEKGTSNPNFETIEKIANICKFKIEFIDEKSNQIINSKNIDRKMI